MVHSSPASCPCPIADRGTPGTGTREEVTGKVLDAVGQKVLRSRKAPTLFRVGAAISTLCLAGCSLIYDSFGGRFLGPPSGLDSAISPAARKLIDEALEGIEPGTFSDFHVHHLSLLLNDEWLSWLHPIKRARTLVYMSASAVNLTATIVKDHLARIVELARALPPGARLYLYAMDRTYREDGTADVERTPFYVPDESVLDATREHPELFVPVISVHPYRKDALEALEAGARAGSRHVKWLPNAMGINPASPLVEPFYRKMVELDMVLLSHTGGEDAFEASYPEFGNPLLLRKPLEMGVKVVALHAASNGKNVDIEDPAREGISSWKLFFRLLEDPRYDGLLFADTASMTFFNHLEGALFALLDREDLHRRFVHGSDYPLCGVNMALWTWKLAWEGFITDEEAAALDEIYGYNPLLFDFVVKRTVRHPVSGKRLALSSFKTPLALGPRPAPAP
jgi:uncharacterized protein